MIPLIMCCKSLMRCKFYKRITLLAITFILSFAIFTLLFGDLRIPSIMHLTDLNKCPACYGVSVCPELYSNQITLVNNHQSLKIFNSKNVYYGFTKSNRKVILKKLAHDWEFKQFDSRMCDTWNLRKDCRPIHLYNVTDVDAKIIDLVQYNLSGFETEPRHGLIVCPHAYSVHELIKPIINNNYDKNHFKSEMLHAWTLLSINPEPLILQFIPKSKGWRVPPFGGVCGRIEVVGYEGEALSSLMHVSWYRKLKYAKEILEAALDFTFKHDRFRFYLMDWSIDNIVANENDEITFVDLEDVIVLDKHIVPGADLQDWYQRYNEARAGPEFTFSIDNICKHHLSDHNIWAACYILASSHSPLLYPLPPQVNASRPHLDRLLRECLYGEDRFKTVTKLQHLITDILKDKN